MYAVCRKSKFLERGPLCCWVNTEGEITLDRIEITSTGENSSLVPKPQRLGTNSLGGLQLKLYHIERKQL